MLMNASGRYFLHEDQSTDRMGNTRVFVCLFYSNAVHISPVSAFTVILFENSCVRFAIQSFAGVSVARISREYV